MSPSQIKSHARRFPIRMMGVIWSFAATTITICSKKWASEADNNGFQIFVHGVIAYNNNRTNFTDFAAEGWIQVCKVNFVSLRRQSRHCPIRQGVFGRSRTSLHSHLPWLYRCLTKRVYRLAFYEGEVPGKFLPGQGNGRNRIFAIKSWVSELPGSSLCVQFWYLWSVKFYPCWHLCVVVKSNRDAVITVTTQSHGRQNKTRQISIWIFIGYAMRLRYHFYIIFYVNVTGWSPDLKNIWQIMLNSMFKCFGFTNNRHMVT